MDIYGLILLTVVLVVVSALMTGGIFGALYGAQRAAADKFPDSNAGALDLENIEKAQLSDFLSRLGLVVFAPTLLLHMVEFLAVGVYIRAHPGVVAGILFILETGALGAGLRIFVKLDTARTIVATAAGAILYLFFYGVLIYGYLQ